MHNCIRILLLIVVCLSCKGYAGTATAPKVIAHRGASKEAPENTLSSFAKAIPIGVDAIEMDVHLTSDGVPIVIHDGIFGRTTDSAYLKRTIDLTAKEVKTLDVGAWNQERFKGEQIPTLEDVLRLVNGSVRMMVEIKKDNSPPKQIVQAVLENLKNYKGPVIIGSFSPEIVQEVMKKAPEYPVIGILEEPHMLAEFRKMQVKHLAIWFPLLSAGLIQQLHDEGIEVWTFTVDNPGLAKHLASIKVDGIITNDPRNIKQVLRE